MAAKSTKRYPDAIQAMNKLECAYPQNVPPNRKGLGHDPQQLKHLHTFKAKMQSPLKQLYQSFGPTHKAEANHYLKRAFGRMNKSLG